MSQLAYWPWLLGAVLALALMILIGLVQLLRRAMKEETVSDEPTPEAPKQEAAAPAPAPTRAAEFARVGEAFRRARRYLQSRGEGNRYAVPLIVLLGAENSREPGFLEQTCGTGLELPDEPKNEGLCFGLGREFLLFDKGVVLDVAGEPVLGSDGQHSDDRMWRRLMRALIEMRAKRPLDGVVVTVSCTELLDAVKSEEERLALAARAARVRRKLWDLQERSGFRLPLYVLVTNCEPLTGFGETCLAMANDPDLPHDACAQILGWSSPYGIHAPYQTSWVDDIFREMREVLSRLQMELFRSGAQQENVLLLPWSFGKLAEPLRGFLDQLLSPGARHEASITRGVYFCGNLPKTTTTAFVAQLFTKKIFCEAGLATPSSSTRMTRSRRAKWVHAATFATAAAVVVCLSWGWWRLQTRHDELLELLQAARSDLLQAPAMNGDELGLAASQLLDQMSALEFSAYSPLCLPASRVTGFDRDLHKALGKTFQVVVLDATRQQLEARAQLLIDDEKRHPAPAAGTDADPAEAAGPFDQSLVNVPIVPVEKTAEFVRLKNFVQKMVEVEQNGALFNRVAITGSSDAEALSTVVRYALHRDLPKRFYLSPMFETVRHKTTPQRFEPSRFARDASAVAKRDGVELYTGLFTSNACAQRVAAVAGMIDPAMLERARPGDMTPFRTIDLTIDQLRSDLADPALEWAFSPIFTLGPAYDSVLASISRSALFDDDLPDALRELGNEELHKLRLKLAKRTALRSPVLKLQVNGDPAMELSRETELMQTAVKTYLGQSFAARDERLAIRGGVDGSSLAWDPAELDQAAASWRAYAEFRDNAMKLFPSVSPNLATAILQGAQEGTRHQINDHLAKAQIFTRVMGGEDQVHVAATAFAASVKPIRAQLDTLRALHATKTANEVVNAMENEGIRLLRALRKIVEKDVPYKPANATFDWDGSAPPAPTAWGTHDPGELAEYLDTTRKRIATLAGSDVAPILDWFAGNPATSAGDIDAIAYWQSIVRDLNDYDLKKPGNPPALLEDYIAVRAAKLTPSDCRAAALRPAEVAAWGFFTDQLKWNAERLTAQCRTLAASRASKRYRELATLFNQTLSQRYPFNEQPPRLGDTEADPEDVRRFYRKYDEARPLLVAVDEDDGENGWFQPAHEFLKKMDGVRRFFAPFLDAKSPGPLQLNVETSFRVPIVAESNAKDIISWTLSIDRAETTQRDNGGKKLPWRPGDDVKLEVRWASDGLRVPWVSSGTSNPAVDNRTVVYRYTNRWSLLTALHDLHAEPQDLPSGRDEQPVTLVVNVLTKPAAGGEPDRRNPAKAFLRVALSGADGQPLLLPETFPSTADPLRQNTAEVTP